MKTQKHKLVFSKKSISELTDMQTNAIKGGCQWSHSSGPTLSIKLSIVKEPTQDDDFVIQ